MIVINCLLYIVINIILILVYLILILIVILPVLLFVILIANTKMDFCNSLTLKLNYLKTAKSVTVVLDNVDTDHT